MAFTLILSQNIWALASPDLAIPFFRTPDSLFSSGQKNRGQLERKKIREQSEFHYVVEVQKKKINVDGRSVARDLHLAKMVYSPRLQKQYPVVGIEGSRVLVHDKQSGTKDSFPLTEVVPVVEDFGMAYTLIATHLRSESNWRSNSLLTIPAKTRLHILGYQDEWIKVEFESFTKITGYIDSQNVLLKVDFASFVWSTDKKWLPVSHREGSEIVLKNGRRLNLSEATAQITRPELAIVIDPDPAKQLILRQHLLILQTENHKWSLSQLKDHGLVYWKSDTVDRIDSETNFKNTLSTDQLLKREITSVSFHPKNPSLGIASAHGIYYTWDGWIWRKLEQFQMQNHPVLITETGEWIVGSHRSTNLGKSFQSFIQVERLTLAVQNYLGTTLRDLRITDLELTGSHQVRLQLNSGGQKIYAKASLRDSVIDQWAFSSK